MHIKTIATVALFALASPALAGDKNWFDKMDANADGYLSAAELGEKKAHKIGKLDTNGDQMISRAEYDEYKARKHGKHKDEA